MVLVPGRDAVRPVGEFRCQQLLPGVSLARDADPQREGGFFSASSIQKMDGGTPASTSPEVPLESVLEMGWNAARCSSFKASSMHDTDSDATTRRGSPVASKLPAGISHSGTMRGAVMALALADKPAASHPGTEGPEDMHLLPASVVVPRGTITMRGELMHVFVSYRVATEGMVLHACTNALPRRPAP